jgi:hypothetical protein
MSRLPPKSQMSETLKEALSGPPRMVKVRNTKLLEPLTEFTLKSVADDCRKTLESRI